MRRTPLMNEALGHGTPRKRGSVIFSREKIEELDYTLRKKGNVHFTGESSSVSHMHAPREGGMPQRPAYLTKAELQQLLQKIEDDSFYERSQKKHRTQLSSFTVGHQTPDPSGSFSTRPDALSEHSAQAGSVPHSNADSVPLRLTDLPSSSAAPPAASASPHHSPPSTAKVPDLWVALNSQISNRKRLPRDAHHSHTSLDLPQRAPLFVLDLSGAAPARRPASTASQEEWLEYARQHFLGGSPR